MRMLLPVLLLLSACATPSSAPSSDAAPTPTLDPSAVDVAPHVARANESIRRLGETLLGRLVEAMADGPQAAVEVCAGEAQALSARIAEEQGLALGRTSHRLRNPRNAPRDWVRPWLVENAGRKAEQVKPAVYDLGDRIGVVRPIPTQPLCTVCHGKAIDPELEATITASYPDDQARGFEAGELRGAFWVEVPKAE